MIQKTWILVRKGLAYLDPWKWSLPSHPFILLHLRGASRSDTSEEPTSSNSEAGGGGRGPGCCIWHAGSENGEAGNRPEVLLKISNRLTFTNVKKHHLHLCFPTWQASRPTVTTSSIPSAFMFMRCCSSGVNCDGDVKTVCLSFTQWKTDRKYFLLWSERENLLLKKPRYYAGKHKTSWETWFFNSRSSDKSSSSGFICLWLLCIVYNMLWISFCNFCKSPNSQTPTPAILHTEMNSWYQSIKRDK